MGFLSSIPRVGWVLALVLARPGPAVAQGGPSPPPSERTAPRQEEGPTLDNQLRGVEEPARPDTGPSV